MDSNTRNVKMGVCSVSFDGEDLGYTKGGVEANVTTETYKVTVDQFGKLAVNEQIMSRMASVKLPLAETILENIVRIMPGSALVTDALKKRVAVEHGTGIDLLKLARPLILHPIANVVTDRNDDFILPLAATAGALQFAYKLEEERIFNTEFSGFPSSQTKRLFLVGDLTAGMLAATIDFTTDILTVTAHGLLTGQGVVMDATVFPTVTSPVVTMSLGKMFFARNISANTFTLHVTAADAEANTAIVNFGTAGTTVKVLGL